MKCLEIIKPKLGLKSLNVIEEEGSSAAKQILEIVLRENVNTIVVGIKLAIILFFPVFLMPAT